MQHKITIRRMIMALYIRRQLTVFETNYLLTNTHHHVSIYSANCTSLYGCIVIVAALEAALAKWLATRSRERINYIQTD